MTTGGAAAVSKRKFKDETQDFEWWRNRIMQDYQSGRIKGGVRSPVTQKDVREMYGCGDVVEQARKAVARELKGEKKGRAKARGKS